MSELDSIFGLTPAHRQEDERQRELEQIVAPRQYRYPGQEFPSMTSEGKRVTRDPDESHMWSGSATAWKQMKPLMQGVAGLVGEVGEQFWGVGGTSSDLKNWALQGAHDGMTEIHNTHGHENHDLTVAWEKAKGGDYGALLDFASYGFGYSMTQFGMSILAAGAGSVIAGPAGGVVAAGSVLKGAAARTFLNKMLRNQVAKHIKQKGLRKLGKEAAEKAAVKHVAKRWSQAATMSAMIGTQELGSIYPEAVEQAKSEGRTLSGGDVARVIGAGIAATLIEFPLERFQLDALMGNSAALRKAFKGLSAPRRTAIGASIGAGLEIATEVAQTATERFGAQKPLTGEDATRDYINAAGLAAIGGGTIGLIGGARAGKILKATSTDDAVNAAMESKEQMPDSGITDTSPETAARAEELAAVSAKLQAGEALTPQEAELAGGNPQAVINIRGVPDSVVADETTLPEDSGDLSAAEQAELQAELQAEQQGLSAAPQDAPVLTPPASIPATGSPSPVAAPIAPTTRSVQPEVAQEGSPEIASTGTVSSPVLADPRIAALNRVIRNERLAEARKTDPNATAEQVMAAEDQWESVPLESLPETATPVPNSVNNQITQPRTMIELAQRLGKLFGKNVVLMRNRAPAAGESMGGAIFAGKDRKTIFLNVDSADATPSAIVGHELEHLMERDAPDLHKKLVKGLVSNPKILSDYLSNLHRDKNVDPGMLAERMSTPEGMDAVAREFVADVFGNRMTERATLESLFAAAPDQTTLQKLIDFVTDFINTALRQIGVQKFAHVDTLVKDLTAAQKLVQEVAGEYLQQTVAEEQATAAAAAAAEQQATAAAEQQATAKVKRPAKKLKKKKKLSAPGKTVKSEQRSQPTTGMSWSELTARPAAKTRRGSLADVIRTLDEENQARLGRVLDLVEDRQAIATAFAEEAIVQTQRHGNMAEWYDADVARLMQLATLLHPELATSEDARMAYTLGLAATSQRTDVKQNLQSAEEVYAYFKKHGRFEEKGYGTAASAVRENFAKLNKLYDEQQAPGEVRRFLRTTFRASELRDAGFNTSELADEQVLGSTLLGSKIGAFYSNLHGNFEPVTIDMWFMRTIGRLTGKIKAFDPVRLEKQLTTFDTVINQSRPTDGVTSADIELPVPTTYDERVEYAYEVIKTHERHYRENKDAYEAETITKSKLVKTSEAIRKNLLGAKDAPTGGQEKRALRNIVRDAVAIVEEQTGTRIPPASLQALVWGPEQKLYQHLGVWLRTTDTNYAAEMESLLREKGHVNLPRPSRSGSRRNRAAGSTQPNVAQSSTQPSRTLAAPEKGRALVGLAKANRKQINEIRFEVVSNDSRWQELSFDQKVAASEVVLEKVVTEAATAMGVATSIERGSGGWHGATNPSFSLSVLGTDPKALPLSGLLGYGLEQEGMLLLSDHEIKGFEKRRQVTLTLPDNSVETVSQVYRRLWENVKVNDKQIMTGHTTVGTQMGLINTADVSNRAFERAIEQELGTEYPLQAGYVYVAMPSNEDYDYANTRVKGIAKKPSLQGAADTIRLTAIQATREALTRSEQRAPRSDRGVVESGQEVSYGQPQENSASAVGYHYSPAPRTQLDSARYGTGLAGEEMARLQDADPRIQQRIYFYLDTGAGVNPEPGVGRVAHRIRLDNLYDTGADPLGLVRNSETHNDFEVSVIDAGFDGYMTREFAGRQGAAVLLGGHQVPTQQVAEVQEGDQVAPLPETPQQQLARDRSLPAGRLTGPRWAEVVQARFPAIYKEDNPVWQSEEPMYLNQLSRRVFEEELTLLRSMQRTDPNFSRWSKSYPVISLDDPAPMPIDQSVVVEALHGTTRNDITEFKAGPNATNNDWGAALYFSNNPEDVSSNYANAEGADLQYRIEETTDEIYENDLTDLEYLDLRNRVENELIENQGFIMPVYVRFDKPFITGIDRGTEIADKEAFIKAVKKVITSPRDRGRALNTAEDLFEKQGHIKSKDFKRVFIMGAQARETTRQVLEAMGYDGIIDETVGQRFNQLAGMDDSVRHYLAFKPTQIKSRFTKYFDEASVKIMRSPQRSAITNSNGQPVAVTPEAVENFRRWFGDSKVVDESGRPLVVYHGTSYNVDTFNANKAAISSTDSSVVAAWVTTDPEVASEYAMLRQGGSAPNIVPVYLRSTNPYDNRVDKEALPTAIRELLDRYERPDGGPLYYENFDNEKIRAGIRDAGFDSILEKDLGETAPLSYAVFEPTQVKSAIGNQGTFDATDPNITRSPQRDAQPVPDDALAVGQNTVDVAGVDRPAFNDQGRPIHYSQTGIANFWRWFGDSETVDPSGQPQVWYHGTTNPEFDRFNTGTADAVFLTQSSRLAEVFGAGAGQSIRTGTGSVLPLYAKVENVFDGRRKDHRDQLLAVADPEVGKYQQQLTYLSWPMLETPKVIDAIKAAGFDGFYVYEELKHMREEMTVGGVNLAVFDPKAVKSAVGNRGSFHPRGNLVKSDQRTVNVDGQDKPTTDVGGRPIHPTVEGVKNYWRWYGDSDNEVFQSSYNGRPNVWYHGTTRNIETGFRTGVADAVFISPDPQFVSEMFAGPTTEKELDLYPSQKSNVLPVFARGEKIFDGRREADRAALIKESVETSGNPWLENQAANMRRLNWKFLESPEVIDLLKSAGFDGFLVQEGGAVNLGLFDPTNVKSAIGNQGTFYNTVNDLIKSEQRAFGQMTASAKRDLTDTGAFQSRPTITERIQAMRERGGVKFRQAIFDKFAPVEDLTEHGYRLARLTKATSGVLEAMITYGVPFMRDGVFDVDVQDRGFIETLRELGGESERFFWWMAANRAEQLMAVGKERNFTEAQIRNLKTLNQNTADNPNREATFNRALSEYNRFNEAVLKIAKESGLIDQAAVDKFRNEFYVPFYRAMEKGNTSLSFSGGLVNQKPWHKLKGSERKLQQDLLNSVLMNWSHLFEASAKNKAAVEILKEAALSGDANLIPQRVANKTKGTVSVRVNGLLQHYEITDPLLAAGVKSITYVKPPWLKPIGWFKRALTFGVTANPSFKIRNLIRDSLHSTAVAQDLSKNPLKNLWEGLEGTSRKSQTYASMLAGGGIIRFGSTMEGEVNPIDRLVRMGVDRATILDADGWTKLKDKMRKGWDLYQDFGEKTENINRVALYERAIARGASHADANFMARDLLDFSMSGQSELLQFFTSAVPFLNARLQGLYRLSKSDPTRMMQVLGTMALASTALMLANRQLDPDFDDIEDWERNAYWTIRFGETRYRIPKPFEVGAFATAVERTAELMVSEEMSAGRYGRNMRDLIMENLSMDPMPQVFKPMLEIWANENSFTGRPIEPMGLARKGLAEDRFTERTSNAARLVGGALGPTVRALGLRDTPVDLSPVQLDHLWQGYFGWLAVAATTTTNTLTGRWGRGEAPAMQLRDAFVVGNFAQSVDSTSSRYLSEMYRVNKDLQQYYDSVRNATGPERAELQARYGDEVQRYKRLQAPVRQISKLNRKMRLVESDENLNHTEKRKRLTAIQQQRNKIARRLLVRTPVQ